MTNGESGRQKRGLVAIDAAMALIILLLIVQIWLLSSTLESFLAGHASVAVPAAIFSGLLFSGCLALNFFVDRLDQESRQR